MSKLMGFAAGLVVAAGSIALGWALKTKAVEHNLSEKDIFNKGKGLVEKGVHHGKGYVATAVKHIKARLKTGVQREPSAAEEVVTQ